MNDNVLTSYSFLAALSENETDIYKTVYLPLFKRIIKNAFGTIHNLMLLEEDYLTICDYCGEFFIKHKNDLIGHTYTVNNITKHICSDCYDYKNKYEVS